MLKIKDYLIAKNEILYITKNHYQGHNPQIDVEFINGKCINIYFTDVKDRNKEFEKLKKQLEERKYYKFYKYENNSNGSDYCFCERPCDSNMSLKCFFENGEICGFMSETLVGNNDNIEEISLNEFAHDFIKPLINANFQNKNQQKEFIKYLENRIKDRNEKRKMHKIYSKSEERLSSQYFILQEILQKYKEIVGDDK